MKRRRKKSRVVIGKLKNKKATEKKENQKKEKIKERFKEIINKVWKGEVSSEGSKRLLLL